MDIYLAKSGSKETIAEHTANLIRQYKILRHLYESSIIGTYLDWYILELVCVYHDIGKVNIKFQNILRRKSDMPLIDENELKGYTEIKHNYISPAFIPDEILSSFSEEEKLIIWQSIYRHHLRHEPDLVTLEKYIKLIKFEPDKLEFDLHGELRAFKIRETPNLRFTRKTANKYILYKTDSDSNKENLLYKYVMTKGLLNKIDYAASAMFEHPEIRAEEPPEDLDGIVRDSLRSKGYNINELQQYMLENKDKNNIVIAATGFGKTEAGLLWIGNNKGFFTLPLKVSINAIHDRIIKMGMEKQKVGLLHSDTFSEYLKLSEKDENEDIIFDQQYLEETKQMSLPLTVCTLDQLIDFVFLYDGFERKLATLAYSRIIIDEIQMYSPDYIACLIMALKHINKVGGKFSILTATFPPVLLDKLNEHDIQVNIAAEPFYKEFLRHRVEVIERNIDIELIKSNFNPKSKILIICNTIGKAQEVYKAITTDELLKDKNVNLLHARFIKKDRRAKESAILEMGKKDSQEYGIWVTTQIVEASLDIDFDVLYTELSEINGLFQRMGRVYRNRILEHDKPNVYVYAGTGKEYPSLVKDDKHYIGIDFTIFNLSRDRLIKNQKNGICDYKESLKMGMVKDIYSTESLKETKIGAAKSYYEILEDTLRFLEGLSPYEYEKGALCLRNIKQQTFIPLQIYKENKDIIDSKVKELKALYKNEKNLKNRIKKQVLRDELNEYTASIDFKRFYNLGLHYDDIIISDYEKYIIANTIYSKEAGVELQPYDKEVENKKYKGKEENSMFF